MINEEPKTDKQKLYDVLSNEYDLGTYEEFERNIGDSVKRKKLFDAAIADYDLGDYDNYSKRIGPTHKESLDAFNAEYGSFLNDFEERDTAETKMSRAGMSSGIIVPMEGSITGEERKRYQELHKQEEALKKAWYTSDEYLAQKDAEAFQLAQMRDGINASMQEYAAANPIIGAEAAAFIPVGAATQRTRGEEADKEMAMYGTASRIMEDTINLHNAPSRYDGANAWQNVRKFGKGAGDTLSDVDFWTMGLTEIADNFGVREVLATVQDKLGNLNDLSEESIENILTPAEKAVLQAWAINAQEQLSRQGDLSRGYQAGQGAAESLGFMAEFMLTGGIGKAAAEGVEQMTKWLAKKTLTSKVVGMADEAAEAVLKSAAEKTASSAVRRYGKNLGLSLAEAAGRTGVMPSTFRNISEKATEIRTDEEGNNYLVGMNNAFASGLADSFIETLSEGGRVGALGELFGDVAGKIPFYKRMVDKLSNSKAGELWDMFQSSGVMNTLRAGGWHGIGEEYLEEWYGNALRTLTGVDKEALKEFATWDNQLITVTSFLPLTIFGGTVSTAQVLSAKRGLDKKAEALRSALIDRGYDEAQADNYIDIMKNASPAEISSLLSPIATTVVGRSEMDARALVKPFMDFAMAVRKWQSFDTKYKYQEQEQRDALQQQMEGTLGKFWQEDETGARRVQRAVNAQGEAVYLLGKQSAADAEAGIPASVPAVAADGRKMFVNPSDYRLEDELDINTFLGIEVMAEKGNTERARMLADQERNIQQIRNAAAPGTQINLGTAEAPVIATVAQRHPDGVIVTTPDGMARQLTYTELGNYMGINATPLTDAQLDEQEADVLLAEQSQREAELDQEYGYDEDSAVEIAEAEEEIVQSAEAVTELPMDSQGNVDETALWNEDPARWAAWNDGQRQDGGANSITAITAAMTNLSGQIAEQETAYAAMPVGTERNDLERQINANKARLAQLTSLQQGYAAQAEAALQAAAQEQAALSASQAQMTEQQMDEMDAQYESIYSQTRSLNERARLLQEYLDKISAGAIPVKVLTEANYAQVMADAGCSKYLIQQIKVAIDNGSLIEGFMAAGKAFIFANNIPTIDKGREKYVHERQHVLTRNSDYVSRILATGVTKEQLKKYLRILSQGNFYDGYPIDVMADEFLSFAMELVYTFEDFSVSLQKIGVSESLINVIKTIDDEQSRAANGVRLSQARRRRGLYPHVSATSAGSGGQNARDTEKVSRGILDEQGSRPSTDSQRGAGDREGGEGTAEPAVDNEINPAFVDAISTDAEGVKFSAKLTDSEIDNLVEAMKANAEVAEDLELTPENWEDQFGSDGMVPTPVGNVKMGENQYLKLLQRKRSQYFGMIRPTLVNPDIVLEELSPSESGERDTVLLFIKTFIKPDGSRYVHFESVTIQKDSMEISISSHEIQEEDLKKKMRNDNVAHLRDSLSASEWRLNGRPSDGSDLVPTPSDNLSDSKDSENLETPSDSARFSVITPQMDADYLAAVERGDMETAQRMVIEAAKLAMPNTKVVDENGNPRVVYHGTNAKFTTFVRTTGKRWIFGAPFEVTSEGFFFAPNKEEAEQYGKKYIIPVFLNITNPLDTTDDYGVYRYQEVTGEKFYPEMGGIDRLWEMMDEAGIADVVKKAGYDGVIFAESLNEYGEVKEMSWAALDSSQIKSADPVTYDDNGDVIPLSERFNPENEDIRFSTVRIDPNANQQAEGNVMFSTRRGSLVGIHNISEDKLRKVIKQGGSANPSAAVIDIERQSFDSYGEISFIMPSSLVDARTGRNAGTFTADAWTPTYPQIQKRFSVDELQRAYWRDITAIPEEMQHEVRMAFDSWLDNRTASGLAYMFLQERGEAPEMVRVEAKFPQEIKDKVSAILGEGRTGLYDLSAEEKQAMLELYIQENFGGNREEFDKSIADRIQRIEDRLSTGKVPSFVEKRITLDLQWMKEHGYNYDNLSNFVRDIVSDIRHAGEVNAAATTNRALDYIKDNNLSAEYEQWKESLNDRYGIKEYLFDGYTSSGNPRWLPNTVENASKLMNKQGLAGATGMASSFNRFVATLAPKKKSLSDIRSSKDLLVEDEKLVDDFRDKWSKVFFDLGIKCQPDAKGYEDYGLERLTEAAQKKNPGAYLKKEYGVELSQEDLQRLADMIKAIKTEFPARYFETKFQRPVYLNEFAAAVIPTTTSADIKQAIAEAGLPIFEYDASADGARREATLKATDIEGVRFSVVNENQAIFVSNAAKAVEGIKQEKATPEQWLKMIEKNGGLKAGEDKWMGLSDWLKESDKKTLTKQEVLDFINENMIVIDEEKYGEVELSALQEEFNEIYDNIIDNVGNEDESNLQLWEVVMNPMERAWEELRDRYSGGDDFDMAFSYDSHGNIEINDPEAAGYFLGVKPINDTRLDYTTRGLQNNQEIALVVPTIESWNETDEVHFGDAGDGRAVAWIRFGETEAPVQDAAYTRLQEIYDRLSELEMKVSSSTGITHEEYDERSRLRKERDELQKAGSKTQRVLVIDEIQSKRHQEGREKGYKSDFKNSKEAQKLKAEVDRVTARLMELVNDKRENEESELTELARLDIALENATSNAEYDAILEEQEKIRTHRENREAEELAARGKRRELAYLLDKQIDRDAVSAISAVPDAPFDKNWHELAMKRMLRYAAENGYDVIAWTKGDQQAERYNIGSYVSSIEMQEEYDGKRDFGFYMGDADEATTVTVDENGTVVSAEGHLSQAEGRPLADLVGKDMAVKMMQMEEYDVLEDTDLKVGNEGMKGFYDRMLPAFMNKYGKKWGVKVEDINLSHLEDGLTMHSVPVTEEMKASVMEGQVMFSAVSITPEVREEMDTIKAKAMWNGIFMKAPNGADTNLTEDQWLLVRTNNFKNWFGDWENDPENASKVVDENGEPKVVYHGSNWRPALEKPGLAKFRMRSGLMGRGAYFTDNFTSAADYAREKYEWEHYKDVDEDFVYDNGYITEAFLNIRNEDNIREYYGETYYLATHPSQIKSATDNTGEFSESGDIRYSSRFDVNTNPTEAQKKAGNYKMGHLRLDGYNITIENPKGSIRRGTDSKGNEWENTLNNDYGYIRGTEGVDGDHIDVYLSDNPAEGNVFVIDQVNPETREFDEHKVMYGFNSMDEAREAYLANFSEGWNGLGTITEVTKDEFRKWIDSSHRKTKPFSEYKSVKTDILDEGDIRYSVVTDPALLERLDGEPTIKLYRAMQLIDGKLYPPMSAKVDGKMREPIELGKWEQAEERPDLADEKGYFKLDKGNKTSLKARYNPYFHTSPTPLNDQFSSAQTRPELVTVEVEVPESELTSGYKADKAKDSVGQMEWKAGVVQGKLSGTRTVILSRWDKPVRIVPDSEVADKIVEMFDGKDITMPSNVVTPSLRAELESRGVPFVETDNKGKPVETDTTYSTLSTPTDEIVAEGMKFSIQDFARLAGNIFQDMPESFRKEAIEETFKRGWDMQSAIFQIPARLAEKENWDESDKELAKVIREKVQDAMDESGVVMSRPLTTKEALWMLYRSTGANGDSMLDAAKRSLVAYNLGFDKETLALEDEARKAVRFSVMRDATINAKASMYNRGAVNVMTRLKESFVDMNASVEELVSAIEERSGKKAKGFENILLALNQQSSKGLAAMESYEMQFLNPMFDEIRKIMNETDFTYEDIVRYVILKHGLERNEKLAQRDARSYYQEIYDDIIDKIRSMSAAQKRTYLTNAQLKDADAKAELAVLQAVDTSAMSADEKKDHKKAIAKAQTAANEAAEHLERAQKIASMSEKEAEEELQKHLDAIAAQTDSKYKELRENDYSGITSMFYDQLGVNRNDYATEEEYQSALMEAKKHKYDTLGDVEGAADMEVELFERIVDTKGLWKKINAATKETLRQQYEANMISKEQYDSLRGMFEYYVPLRGFADNTAEDMYTYYRRPNSTGYTKPILGAEGRKTEAESPFGWIASMAGSAIASNVKNEAKLALYYFVSNRPENGIATVSKTWYVHTPGDVDERGKRIFRPAYPTFSEDLSTEEAKAKLEQWQEQMRELKKQGLAYESGQKLNLGNAVVNISDANKPEHIVNVKVAGRDYTIIINGNPRAAQAINGDLNIEATSQDYSAVFGPILRWMSSVNTSYNPEFWITNMMRDMAFTWMSVNTKESPEYRRKFSENYRKAFSVIKMVAKNEKGTLGDSYLEKMYKEFVEYGGVTGYTQIRDNETWEKEIEKYLSSNDPKSIRSGKMMRGVKTVFHAAHRFGESLEQVSRFAAFLTSREMGKPMAEAVNDAKEITVNFNRKGSGKMISLEEAKHLTGRNGKPLSKFWQWVAVAASSISPLGRRFIMFFNAAIQGLNATYKLYKANPKRMVGWTLAYAAVGAMNAVLHAFMDDDDDYLDMPQYERRNSLMIGGNGVYFKWALPQEARAFYALGDLAVESIMGRNPHQNVAGEMGKIFAELLPINPAEGAKAFLPSVAVPAFELLLNEDYKGDPIYNEMKWMTKEERKRTAKWSNAKKGTGKAYVLLSKGLNNATGGDMYDAGLINIQPEKVEHLVQSAFGGTIRTADKFITTVMAMVDPEEEWTARQTPFLNRILTINDERFRNVHVNDVFDYYRAEAEHAITLEKKYTKAKDSKALRELRSSDEYKWAKVYTRHRKALENINDKLREAEGTQEKKELMKRQDELKKKMIKEFSSAR